MPKTLSIPFTIKNSIVLTIKGEELWVFIYDVQKRACNFTHRFDFKGKIQAEKVDPNLRAGSTVAQLEILFGCAVFQKAPHPPPPPPPRSVYFFFFNI